jgi:lipopolysaccharide assembly outer membrane protein LptD (OstA)
MKMRPLFEAFLLILVATNLVGQEPFSQTDPFESRFKQKTNFQIRFRAPEKGGEIRLYTKNPVQYEKDQYWEGSGEVVIEYQDVKITADHARYVFPTDVATLEGHVVIDQGPTRMAGDRAVFKMKEKTGRMENATADLAPTYHIVAQSIEKIGEATYRIEKGIFTACDLPRPAWSFYLSEAVVTLDDYAHMKNVSFRIRSTPLLYTPYLVWPTKEDRATGFLVPGVGANGDRGAYLGLTHYWVTGRSTDLTSTLDLYSKGTVGLGEEFRWTPTPESAGIFQGYGVHDREATVCVPLAEEPSGGDGACLLPDGTPGVFTRRTKNRWKVRLDHVSDDLPWGFRGVAAIRDYSDDQYLQDLERSFALNSSRQVLSRLFFSRNAGDDSFNLRAERGETFFGTKVTQERIPSLEYFRRTSRIGSTPLFFAAEASISYLYVNRGTSLPRGAYGRADVHPTLSLPWKRIPWLSITAKAGGRWTGYTDSVDDGQTHFVGSSFRRAYGEAGLSIVGPSFSRIYDGNLFQFGKFKHVIEPRIDYDYVSEVSDPQRIPAYDEVDLQLGRNQVRYALVNRLLARPADLKQGAAREIASLEISQTRAFRLPQTVVLPGTIFQPLISKEGPVSADLRVAPGPFLQFEGRIDYDTKAASVTSSSITTAVTWKTSFVNATYFAARPVLATPLPAGSTSPNSDQFRVAAGVDLGKSVRVDTQLNYDARQRLLLEDRSLLTYKGSCYTVFLEVRQLRLPPTTRRDVRLVFNLKDIGTLLDFHQSLDRIFGQ